MIYICHKNMTVNITSAIESLLTLHFFNNNLD